MKRTTLIALLALLSLYAVAQQSKPGQDDAPLELLFAPQGGFYEQGVEVKLICPGAAIYYTLDGSSPSPRSLTYEGPFYVSTTSVVRAVAYLDGKKPAMRTNLSD
ncbi:MAG: chitobiase/beta-hexosaminidase C-terminal domain-containing protein [Saprospiraceae bacterium]|nr:chitobiase/beta-hexosaminidase C-terminal domain-containing protein [Saprospiraceae bacterium]